MKNSINLTEDYAISRVIRGGWQLSTGHVPGKEFDREAAIENVLDGVRSGMTTIDMGDIYTGVEELVGDARLRLPDPSMLQVHTKYVPDRDSLPVHTEANARTIMDRSRSRLNMDCLDMVQFHWWRYDVPGAVDTMKMLAAQQREGLIRLIGVTNFDVPHMQKFAEAGVMPATIQLQYSVLDRRPENGMAAFCAENNVKILCYGTVAGGFLSEKYLGAPEPTGELPNRSLTKYKLIIEDFGGWKKFQELLRTLDVVAKRHETSIATIASAYVLGKPQVAAVIVGAHDRAHMQENVKIPSVVLNDRDLDAIDVVTRTTPGPIGDVYTLERESPRHAGIMRYNNNAQAAS